MKKNRLVAALLSLVMMVGALPGLVSADIAYDVQVGASITLDSIRYPGPYYNGTPVGIVVSGGVPEYEGAFYNYSFYNTDGNVEVRSITLDSMGMGYFNVPNNIYTGTDSSRYTIDVSPYYNTLVADHDNCADYCVRFSDMITGETLIQSNSCSGGSKVRVYATPVDGYYIESVDYEYTFNDVSQTGIAELKTDSSGSYYEFTMPFAPVSVFVHTAENGHKNTSYIDVNGNSQDVYATIIDASSPNNLTNGWYVVTGNVEHAERFDVTGDDVNIILEDGASLNAQKGIAVNFRTDYNNTLNIWGQSGNTGVLTANGGAYEAGIGGGQYYACGTVNIYGGTVNATGGTEGAGIGTGHLSYGRSSHSNVNVNIYGGTVNAKGGFKGAGIGTGSIEAVREEAVSIHIYGGNVRAERGSGSVNGTYGMGYGFSDMFIECNITFDCTGNRDISVYADSYSLRRYDQSLTLNGTFIDEYGQTHTGTITNSNVSTIEGRTLVREGTIPSFTGHSLTVADEIGVNYFVDMSMLSDEERQSATVEFTINGDTVTDGFDPDFTNEDGDYGFTLNIMSIQMADTITAVLHVGENTYHASNYSVQAYYDQIIADPATYGTNVVNFVKALKDYGHYVQPFLSLYGRTRWTLGTDHAVSAAENELGESDLQAIYDIIENDAEIYVPVVSAHDGIGLTYTVGLETTTVIRVYVDPGQAGFAGPVSVTVDGQSVDPVLLSDGRYRIDINNISAKHLDVGHVIRFSYGEGEGQFFTISNLSALSYVRLIMDSSNTFHNDDESQYAMCALYRYWQAAQNVN